MAHVFDSPPLPPPTVIWYARSIQWSKCKPPKWECDDDCIAEWLDEAANMSDRVFTPSDSFIFPSYLHTLPSFILTVKSLNLWYPIPFILTASLSPSLSPSLSLSLSLSLHLSLSPSLFLPVCSGEHLLLRWLQRFISFQSLTWICIHTQNHAGIFLSSLVSSLFRHHSFWLYDGGSQQLRHSVFEQCEYISGASFIYRNTLSFVLFKCSGAFFFFAVALHSC